MSTRSLLGALLAALVTVPGCSLPGRIVVDDAGVDASADASDATLHDAADARDEDGASDAADDAQDTGPADAYSSSVAAPRPIAPASGSIQTNHEVTLEWQSPAGTTGALVELCRTRACASVTTVAAPGPATRVALSAAQVHSQWNYWRVRGTAGGLVSSTASPTWQFNVPSNATAPRAGHYGAVLDWNGDGIPDVAVGSSSAVALYAGRSSGYSDPPSATLTRAGDPNFGAIVASVGDVDGNGFADLVVIAQGTTARLGTDATAFIYHSDGLGYTTAPDRVPLASTTVHSASWAGDLNHDGYGDIVLGATDGDAIGHPSGEVYVILGSPSPITTALRFANTASGHVIGVSGAGDVDGDGFDDFAMSAATYSTTSGPSAAYVFAGGVTIAGTPVTRIDEPGNESFDGTISAGCDFNQDGWPDLAFGVFGNAASGTPGIERYHDAGAGTFAMTYLDSSLGASGFVAAVSCGGDVSGDGVDDLLFTVPSSAPGGGAVHVLSAPHSVATSANFSAVILGAHVGEAIDVIGDFDGDGLADVALGGSGGSVAILRGTATVPYLNTAPASIDVVFHSDTTYGVSVALSGRARRTSWTTGLL